MRKTILDLFCQALIGCIGQILSCSALNLFAVALAMPAKFVLIRMKFVSFRSIRTNRTSLLYFTLLALLSSCAEKPVFDEAIERENILALHHAQRKYHFEKDSIAFVHQMSDKIISVNRGKITHPTAEENLTRLNGYFSSVEFEKWDDLAEPIIRFSDDGSIAYTIVDKEVVLRYENEEGVPEEETTHFCWVAIYRKYPEGWKIDCVASTNEPSVVTNL